MVNDENKKNEYAKDVECAITKVSAEVVDQTIKKITFTTSKGDITWKPKITHTRMVNGMTCSEKVPMLLGEMPPELISFNQEINRVGIAKAKICYGIMKVDQDGEEKVYRFIRSMKEFLSWQFIKEEQSKVE